MRFRSAWIVLGCLVILLASVTALYAQGGNGTLQGRVTDKAGRPVVGATVSATNLATGQELTAKTDADGRYKISDLAPGKYTIHAETEDLGSPIFQETIIAGAAASANFRMEPRLREEVTVTGSLIPRPTLEAMSPVSTLDVQELNYQGTARLEDFLTNLPQVFRAQNATQTNGASGTATVDLRFLGPQRTLVLIDGRRMPVGDAGGLVGNNAVAPDLNFIPAALVKRVDILTGGASATYGADAVSGVVNFILDREFEGVKAGINGSVFEHDNNNDLAHKTDAARGFKAPSGTAWDGGTVEAYFALGGKFAEDKGHASMYIDFRNQQGLLKNRRDYTNCSVSSLSNTPTCSGSGTAPTGNFLVFDPTFTDLVDDFTVDFSGPGNTFRDFAPSDLFNFATFNYMQRPDRRFTAGGFLDYVWNEHAHGYAEVMMMDDKTDAQIAPSGDFFTTNFINCDNPALSAQERQVMCTDNGYGPTDIANVIVGRRNVEGGPRIDKLSHQSFRLVGGAKGDINKIWSYDVYGLHAETRVPETFLNDLNTNRLQQALLVQGDPADPSTWHCAALPGQAVPEAGCVPWNIFRAGGVTPQALAFIRLPLVSNSDVRTQLASAKVNGDLKGYGVVVPTASEGVQVALGTEFRKEYLQFLPDFAYQTGIGSGQGGSRPAITGSYYVKEAFAEFLVPLVQGASWAKDLSLDLGYRSSTYSTNGRWPTWRMEGSWAPMADFKLRGGVNRATRAPNINELFSPAGVQLSSGATTDPCAGLFDPASPPAGFPTLAQCEQAGVTAAQYGNIIPNPASQYNVFAGGNPLLNPEVADTTTAGIVITPTAIPSFSAAFDYYDIEIKRAIASLSADSILNSCVATGNPALCSLIHRDFTGSLWLTPGGFTVTTNQNIGSLRAQGVDVDVSYALPIAESTLNFNVIGSYLMKSFIDTGIFSYDCVGLFGNTCGQPTPRWRHLARISWEKGPTTVTLAWRLVGRVRVDASSDQAGLSSPADVPLYKLSGSFYYGDHHYFDIAATYNLRSHLRATVGVNNIADKNPPLAAGFSPNDFGPGFFGTYDPYGRVIHASLLMTF